jgi:phosphatidate cytidylyltransferase
VALLAGAAAVWGLSEMAAMLLPERRRGALALFVGLGVPVFLAALGATAAPGGAPWFAGALVLAMLGSAAWVLVTADSTVGLADRWARALLALVYVPLPLALIPGLIPLDGGRGWLWTPLFAAWCGDIGGYFAGRFWGRTKMAPLISPKKTWAGFWGGAALSTAGLVLFKYAFFDTLVSAQRGMTLLDCVVIGVLAYPAAVAGDLVESMIKRSVGMKDSGSFLPGHGGMLDRIDSTLFSTPVVWIWLVLLRPVLLP